jgi:hypothetical protein
MRFRFKAFGFHLLASALALTLVLGTLYLGWYRWPGWYVAGVSTVAGVLIGVDLTIGPMITFIIAHPNKPRRSLARDIAIIAACQCCALVYGTVSLWQGRPLYYAFSENVLQLVQAYDISAHELDLGRAQNPELAPHWYSLPRWIWAPLPADPKERQAIVAAALDGGDDVIAMPRLFKHWDQGLPELRKQLKTVDHSAYFMGFEKKSLKARMQAAGLSPDQANTLSLSGRGRPLLVVFDPTTLKIVTMLAPARKPPPQFHSRSAHPQPKASNSNAASAPSPPRQPPTLPAVPAQSAPERIQPESGALH